MKTDLKTSIYKISVVKEYDVIVNGLAQKRTAFNPVGNGWSSLKSETISFELNALPGTRYVIVPHKEKHGVFEVRAVKQYVVQSDGASQSRTAFNLVGRAWPSSSGRSISFEIFALGSHRFVLYGDETSKAEAPAASAM